MQAFFFRHSANQLQKLFQATPSSRICPLLSRALSSLASTPTATTLEAGQTLVGAKGRYLLTTQIKEGIHLSTVFKGKVLSESEANVPEKWVLIKMASSDPDNKKALKQEYDAHCRPGIASSSYIREMWDIVGDSKDLEGDDVVSPPCLIFEWMDCTLAKVPPEDYRQNYVLLEAIMKAGLSSLVALHEEGLVNTDLKPANILLSDIDTSHPIVKVGDLGIVRPDGFCGPAQPFAMRAPEVYQGLGCFHSSAVWALAVTLFCCLKYSTFGIGGNQIPLINESWCIAKLMLLFPQWTGPPVDINLRQLEFKLAKTLTVEPDPKKPGEKLIKVSSLEHEMQTMDIPQELRDLFRYLFVPNPNERPSAAEALASEEFLALKKKAALARAAR